MVFFFFSSRRRHTRFDCDWSSDVCSSDLELGRSFKLGVIRLTERYVKSDPIEPREERKLVRHIDEELGDYLDQIVAAGFDRLVGTSGTILSLGAVASAAQGRPAGGLRTRRISAQLLHRVR